MHKSFLYPLYVSLLISLSAKAQVPGAIIDVQHYGYAIQVNDQNDTIVAKADVTVRFLQEAGSFSLDLARPDKSGKGMTVTSVMEKKNQMEFKQGDQALTITAQGREGSKHTYTITYRGVPADGLIIGKNKFGHRGFFGDNWPNRAHNWMPCVDDPADKATVDFVITAPAHYQVVANGAKVSEVNQPGGLKVTHWKESEPLSTKIMVIGIADFAIDHVTDVGKIPVYSYVYPENKDVGFAGYAYAKEILPFYIQKFGPYAFEKLANVQSKTRFGGLENAGCIFYYENSVGDRSLEELMAHEIAHQWFGDAATEKSFAHLWLSEGFATYMTNVYLENKYGEDILKQRLIADRADVFAFEKTRFTPVVDTAVKDDFMQLLNPNSYKKGGWVLHMLRRKLGEEKFWKGIREYYEKYNGGNANTDDFQAVMQKAGEQPLEQFFKQWLYTPGHLQLSAKWAYDPAEKMVTIEVGQVQNNLYEFTLECRIGDEIRQIEIKNKLTTVQLLVTATPSAVIFDPNVNLLAEIKVEKGN
ncbi:M1 family metallopeptidase [Mucilaginibacter sp.]|jgi:aminopeptidase N|uniref:M1 family metallopeptidase n=1 Tax=Mucilaginibacter sp. TaxID=1882438 RepID=UPI002C14E7E7|nr:M1 family metallopeptidase [Mucilaginibacter sp.]HTI59983.1 M1 family metallopeptidase [Mucilaginibacter sp.]